IHREPVTLLLAAADGAVGLFLRVPETLRAIVTTQLLAQYPYCTIEEVPEELVHSGPGDVSAAIHLYLAPDVFPLKRYGQFEDALNRVTADPITALLSSLSSPGRDRVRRS